MRTIDVSEVTKLVRQLCIDANYYLPADLRQAFVDGREAEQSPLGKEIFGEMIANCDLARENDVPVCQDTGMAIVFAEVGQDVHLTGGAFEDAVTEGVRRGYIDGYLRLSVVGDPLRRENTNDNTPCVLYTSIVPGDEIKITVAPKGFGSENMSAMKMFTPAATKEQIVDFIADARVNAGSNPCPPIVIGVGLGGTSDKAAYLAKRALLRPVGEAQHRPAVCGDGAGDSGQGQRLGRGPAGPWRHSDCAFVRNRAVRHAYRGPAVCGQYLVPCDETRGRKNMSHLKRYASNEGALPRRARTKPGRDSCAPHAVHKIAFLYQIRGTCPRI